MKTQIWKITDAQIVAIARAKGRFRVSWKSCDENVMRMCKRLCRDGLLLHGGGKGETFFYPIRETK